MNRRIPVRRILETASSLRLTVALLVLSVILIFAATLDQVHLGVWAVQVKYFHSFLIWGTVRGTDLRMPIFPGGYLIGGILLVNLITAHLYRFRFAWSRAGIWLTHLGLILLLLGEGISGALQQDGQMRLDVGATRRYAESFHDYELALVDTTNPRYDQVVSIPTSLLTRGELVQSPKLPFLVKPLAYYPNSSLRMRSQVPGAPQIATMGAGTQLAVLPASPATKDDDSNWPAAYVDLEGPDGTLGVWLVSAALEDTQPFTYQGHTWEISLRPKRDYLPFTITLLKFTHDVYPGTDIPKNFASVIRLRSDDGRDDRLVRIYMNNPLRYGGRAFYQSGYANNDRTSVFEVVRNPSWRMPYISCGLIALGLVLQFCLQLWRYLRRGKVAKAVREARGPIAGGEAAALS